MLIDNLAGQEALLAAVRGGRAGQPTPPDIASAAGSGTGLSAAVENFVNLLLGLRTAPGNGIARAAEAAVPQGRGQPVMPEPGAGEKGPVEDPPAWLASAAAAGADNPQALGTMLVFAAGAQAPAARGVAGETPAAPESGATLSLRGLAAPKTGGGPAVIVESAAIPASEAQPGGEGRTVRPEVPAPVNPSAAPKRPDAALPANGQTHAACGPEAGAPAADGAVAAGRTNSHARATGAAAGGAPGKEAATVAPGTQAAVAGQHRATGNRRPNATAVPLARQGFDASGRKAADGGETAKASGARNSDRGHRPAFTASSGRVSNAAAPKPPPPVLATAAGAAAPAPREHVFGRRTATAAPGAKSDGREIKPSLQAPGPSEEAPSKGEAVTVLRVARGLASAVSKEGAPSALGAADSKTADAKSLARAHSAGVPETEAAPATARGVASEAGKGARPPAASAAPALGEAAVSEAGGDTTGAKSAGSSPPLHPAEAPADDSRPGPPVQPAAKSAAAAEQPSRDGVGLPRETQTHVVSQVVKNAILSHRGGQSEIQIQIEPESLGRVHLRVAADQYQVVVRMMTETVAAKEIIEHNVHMLKAELANQGMDVDRFTVSVFDDNDARSFSGHDTRRGHPAPEARKPSESETPSQGAEDEPSRAPTHAAGRGRVDYFA